RLPLFTRSPEGNLLRGCLAWNARNFSRVSFDLAFGRASFTGDRRATGVPRRVMVMRSPLSTRSKSSESLVLASQARGAGSGRGPSQYFESRAKNYALSLGSDLRRVPKKRSAKRKAPASIKALVAASFPFSP